MQTKDTKEQLAARRHAHYLLTHPGAKTGSEVRAEKDARSLRTEKPCKVCGIVKPMDEFVPRKISADGRSYRCRDCTPKGNVPRICQNPKCGRTFLAWPSKVEQGKANYCSHSCRGQHLSKGTIVGVRGTSEERFWRKVDQSPGQGPKGECWTWIGSKNANGQGLFGVHPGKESLTLAHNFSWTSTHGEIPEGLKVIQKCRNNSCVRCLFLGRRADKNIDARSAKRARTEKACKWCLQVKPMSRFGPSKVTADGKAYRCRECMQAQAKARYAKDPTRLLAYRSKWGREHRETGRHVAHRRRARKKGLPGTHTKQEWLDLCKKFKYRCVCCGAKAKLTRDHIIPITDARSSNSIENLQPLCLRCNTSKGNYHATDYRKSPFIRQGQTVMF